MSTEASEGSGVSAVAREALMTSGAGSWREDEPSYDEGRASDGVAGFPDHHPVHDIDRHWCAA